MRYVDLHTWPRRQHFERYRAFDHPHFGMCANVDVTAFYPAAKQLGCSLTVAITHLLSRAANAIPEFRYRIRAGQVVKHDVVHPSVALLTQGDLFSFCTFDYVEEFSEFAAEAVERVAFARDHPTLDDDPRRDDLLFMTAIPWVSFTSFMHPLNLQPPDSVPRFAWGKFFEAGESLKMPLGVQAHHALMDGIHVGRFYTMIQRYLSDPDAALG